MEEEATIGAWPAALPARINRVGSALAAVALRAAIIFLIEAAWQVSRQGWYTPGSDVGYWMGVTGGSLMLVLLIYPLRKRFRVLSVLGPLRHWFRFHIVAGIAGPTIVLFHSTFHVGSFNAAIALASMLLVVASGLVGRYLYRKIHNGLYGSRATATELQRSLAEQLARLQPVLAGLPTVEHEVSRFSALVSLQPVGRWARAIHFASLGIKRHVAGRRVRRAIARHGRHMNGNDFAIHADLRALAHTLDDTLKAILRTAQFSTYEKLFSLWHVAHIPFLCLLVITAIVHVLAVHAY